MKIDGVFSGGGVKAFAFLGALETLEQNGYSFVRVAGTSAGAIVAGFLAAGYTAQEMKQMFYEVKLETFKDQTKVGKYIPFFNWLMLYFSLGLYKGEVFEKWLDDKLAGKGVYTFHDIPSGSFKVVASDLTLGKLIVLPDDLQRIYGINPNDFKVSKAIRMSAGLPYFFKPEKIVNNSNGKSLIVDGAILSNLPLWVLDQQHPTRLRPLIAIKLSESIGRIPKRKIKNALDMLQSLFITMMTAHDARYISMNHTKDVLFLPVKDVDTSNLSLTNEKKDELIELGKEHATKFLKHWP